MTNKSGRRKSVNKRSRKTSPMKLYEKQGKTRLYKGGPDVQEDMIKKIIKENSVEIGNGYRIYVLLHMIDIPDITGPLFVVPMIIDNVMLDMPRPRKGKPIWPKNANADRVVMHIPDNIEYNDDWKCHWKIGLIKDDKLITPYSVQENFLHTITQFNQGELEDFDHMYPMFVNKFDKQFVLYMKFTPSLGLKPKIDKPLDVDYLLLNPDETGVEWLKPQKYNLELTYPLENISVNEEYFEWGKSTISRQQLIDYTNDKRVKAVLASAYLRFAKLQHQLASA